MISPGRKVPVTFWSTLKCWMASPESALGAAPRARAAALTGASAAEANTSGTVTMSRSTLLAGSLRV